jgi:hypothetical protein
MVFLVCFFVYKKSYDIELGRRELRIEKFIGLGEPNPIPTTATLQNLSRASIRQGLRLPPSRGKSPTETEPTPELQGSVSVSLPHSLCPLRVAGEYIRAGPEFGRNTSPGVQESSEPKPVHGSDRVMQSPGIQETIFRVQNTTLFVHFEWELGYKLKSFTNNRGCT